MRCVRAWAAALVGVTAASCAPTVKVTYRSDPSAATLYANNSGQHFGSTPVTLSYRVSNDFFRGVTCLTVQPIQVRWASGAESSVSNLSVCPQQGRNQEYVFFRPADAPGRELDVKAAIAQDQLVAAQLAAETERLHRQSVPIVSGLLLFGGPSHETFLGCIDCSRYDADSIMNPYGSHGSRYGSESIVNPYSSYGSRYSHYGACNPYATDPPVIVDRAGSFYGRLTMNRYHHQRTTNGQLLAWLAGVCA